MSEPQREQIHAVVHGRVQGVGFRDATQHRAYELGVSGWVRNQPDNTVEVVAEGDHKTLEQFLAFLWRGPNAARVLRVDYDWHRATGSYKGFSVR